MSAEENHTERELQEKPVFGRAQGSKNEDRFLRGRQIAKMNHEYFLVTGAHEPILDFCDLMSVTLRGDDVEGFDTRWDEVLSSTEDVPSHNVQVSLYKRRISESEQLETALA